MDDNNVFKFNDVGQITNVVNCIGNSPSSSANRNKFTRIELAEILGDDATIHASN